MPLHMFGKHTVTSGANLVTFSTQTGTQMIIFDWKSLNPKTNSRTNSIILSTHTYIAHKDITAQEERR